MRLLHGFSLLRPLLGRLRRFPSRSLSLSSTQRINSGEDIHREKLGHGAQRVCSGGKAIGSNHDPIILPLKAAGNTSSALEAGKL